MAQTKNEKNNENAGGVDYIAKIQKAKEPFKNEILKMQTKEEKIIYLNQQKQRYAILKEKSNNVYLMSTLISFCVLMNIILLFANTERSIFFKSLMFTVIILAGIIWTVLFITMKNTSTNYTIILFALDDLKDKIQGSFLGGYDDVNKLKEIMANINSEIDETKQQVKEGYSILDQRMKELSKK